MAFEALVITDAGRALLASAMQGGGITFTRAQLGDGQITTQTLAALTALVSPVITLPISSASHLGDIASVVVDFSNAVVDSFTGDGATIEFTLSASPASLSGVTVGGAAAANYTYTANSGKIVFSSAPSTGAAIAVSYGVPAFSWREIGVFAADPDHPNDRTYDILYCYQNAGTAPIAIPAPGDTPYNEQITIKIHVSSVQTINVYVSPGVNARNVAFDPTGVEGVTGTTIQAAISELATKVAGKQGTITVNGILKGAGDGSISAAEAGTDYVAPVEGKGLSSNDYTTAEKTKLEELSAPAARTATLTVAGWSNKAQSVSVAGVTANSIVTVTYAPASRAAWIDADVYCSAQGAGTLTFMCDTVPTQALTANIVILA
nr:MAG TPA: tail-collar fiber protein [Caudoviricetes sp.]